MLMNTVNTYLRGLTLFSRQDFLHDVVSPYFKLQKPRFLKKKFRDKPKKYLSTTKVKSMLKKKGIFDGRWNKYGSDFPNDYSVQNNGYIVYDHASGLMWQQSGSNRKVRFKDIKDYLAKLNREQYAGYNDWRLPTLEEAMSLVEPDDKQDEPYIDPIFNKRQKFI